MVEKEKPVGVHFEELFEGIYTELEERGIEHRPESLLLVREGRVYLSRDDTAKITGITYSTLRKQAMSGKLETKKTHAKGTFFSFDSVLDYFDNRLGRPGPKPKNLSETAP